MAKSCLFAHRALWHLKLEPAARDVDHVPVLDICWSGSLAANRRPKVNCLGTLYPIDYASQVNTARASVVTHSAGAHDRLVHSGRAIKSDWARSVGKSGYDHSCPAVLQRDQHFVVFKLAFIVADKFMLKIDLPLARPRALADTRQPHLAVSAHFLRLVRDGLVRIGNLDHISGREPYSCVRTGRIRQ